MTTNENAYVIASISRTFGAPIPGDQQAAENRAAELRQLVRSLDEGGSLRDQLLVLADDLRENQSRRRVVRREETADEKGDGEQRGERQVARPVEDRDQGQQRCAGRVGDVHRPFRAEPRDHGAARDPEEADGDQLRGEHPAHAGGGARRRQDEPR
jgi:hypothetical protein